MAYFHCLASWQTRRGTLRRDRCNIAADDLPAAVQAARARYKPRAARALDLTVQPYRAGYIPADYIQA